MGERGDSPFNSGCKRSPPPNCFSLRGKSCGEAGRAEAARSLKREGASRVCASLPGAASAPCPHPPTFSGHPCDSAARAGVSRPPEASAPGRTARPPPPLHGTRLRGVPQQARAAGKCSGWSLFWELSVCERSGFGVEGEGVGRPRSAGVLPASPGVGGRGEGRGSRAGRPEPPRSRPAAAGALLCPVS